MSDLEIVTTSDRTDLEDETRAAFRQNWPEFIFHDPVSREHIGRVESYFPFYDVLRPPSGATGRAAAWPARRSPRSGIGRSQPAWSGSLRRSGRR